MNLVSNFVGSISPNMFGENAQGLKPSMDIDDKTFADMLEKQMQKEIQQTKPNFIDMLGLPTGLDINNFNTENNIINMERNAVSKSNETFEASMNNNSSKDSSTSEVVTFFSSLFDSKPTLTDTIRTGLFDFERKVAANSYGKYAKNIVTNLGEFVSDAIKLS